MHMGDIFSLIKNYFRVPTTNTCRNKYRKGGNIRFNERSRLNANRVNQLSGLPKRIPEATPKGTENNSS